MNNASLDRARGSLLGQLSGDALGSLVEFRSPQEIRKLYPDGVRLMADGGTFNTIAGQPTDDSELALLLARSILKMGRFDEADVETSYRYWLNSNPFDCGNTIGQALRGNKNHDSQANGAMMRASPLGIFGAFQDLRLVSDIARSDAKLTHPNTVCVDANELYVMAIAHAIRTGCEPAELYDWISKQAVAWMVEPTVLKTIYDAAEAKPVAHGSQMGWVLIAFQNALWQLLHAPSLEEGVVDTIMLGGDTDTNAAIAGALLGAVYGKSAIPAQWQVTLATCRPEVGAANVIHPRPQAMWPVDAQELAERLLTEGANATLRLAIPGECDETED